MDFELSDDQRALQDAAADLLGSLSTTEQVRASALREEAYDAGLWKAMVDQGWTGVELPEQQGGLGLGMVEAVVLAEQVGAHVAPAPFLENLLAAGALADTDARSWVERLVTGDAIACVAWRPDIPVPYAPAADVAVVIKEEEVLLVDLSGGPAIEREAAMDLTRPLGWLRLEGRATTSIGGATEADRLLDRGAALYAAALLGGAQRVLAMSTGYAKERVQFGKPIGSFQAVKHRCADMLVDVEGMRSTAYWAAWCLSAEDDEASIAASTAKTWCSDAARRVMASALQVHGGIGFTWEHDLHLFLKRSQLDQVAFGDGAYHRERLGAMLRKSLEPDPPMC
ncbi:MAG TPA: acyl-CoA dehydrogenase family protein [Acidimicrobiales bacterium]|jgi:alkylation response protein AidB-like acyl-CoA dehydrogenase|nr:acyl-CoA dehydrogenase family protein [Acidimicrobiales bacterium]